MVVSKKKKLVTLKKLVKVINFYEVYYLNKFPKNFLYEFKSYKNNKLINSNYLLFSNVNDNFIKFCFLIKFRLSKLFYSKKDYNNIVNLRLIHFSLKLYRILSSGKKVHKYLLNYKIYKEFKKLKNKYRLSILKKSVLFKVFNFLYFNIMIKNSKKFKHLKKKKI